MAALYPRLSPILTLNTKFTNPSINACLRPATSVLIARTFFLLHGQSQTDTTESPTHATARVLHRRLSKYKIRYSPTVKDDHIFFFCDVSPHGMFLKHSRATKLPLSKEIVGIYGLAAHTNKLSIAGHFLSYGYEKGFKHQK